MIVRVVQGCWIVRQRALTIVAVNLPAAAHTPYNMYM